MRPSLLLFTVAATGLCAACDAEFPSEEGAATTAETETGLATGTFTPLNEGQIGQSPTGTFTVSERDGELVFELATEGLSAGMHLAHIHGFAETSPEEAACPTIAADDNGDGYVDLIETRDTSGVTMIPLTDDPAGLEIHSQSYPSAGEDGRVTYSQAVERSALEQAVQQEFGSPLALEGRVVYIHGVAEGTELPQSVQSLDGTPASVTLPIACAQLG